MPAIAGLVLTLAQWLIGSKTGRILLLILAGLAAFGAYTVHIEHKAAARASAAIVERERAATAAEHERRERALQEAQREAASAVARLAQKEKTNADLMQKIRRLSAAHDRDPGIDRDAVGRLQQLR